MTINVELLAETLDWAYGEYLKQKAGKPSEWEQCQWVTDVRWSYVYQLERSGIPYAQACDQADKLGLSAGCGTACCIAGRVVLRAGWKPYNSSDLDEVYDKLPKAERFAAEDGDDVVLSPDGKARTLPHLAVELLGLPSREADAREDGLFNGSNTIFDLYRIASELTSGAVTMPAELAAELEAAG